MSVNVNRETIDPFYRYKMPLLIIKKESNKTIIENLEVVGASIYRSPIVILKFFCYEIGAQTRIDVDTRYIINGQHERNDLQNRLDLFISKFVLCDECDNPETEMKHRRKTLYKQCKACGHCSIITENSKLVSFIVNKFL